MSGWRRPTTAWPVRSWPTSAADGFWTRRTRRRRAYRSSVETIVAPASAYAGSGIAAPAPAPRSTRILEPGRRELAERFGYQGDAPLAGRGLPGDADLHGHHLDLERLDGGRGPGTSAGDTWVARKDSAASPDRVSAGCSSVAGRSSRAVARVGARAARGAGIIGRVSRPPRTYEELRRSVPLAHPRAVQHRRRRDRPARRRAARRTRADRRGRGRRDQPLDLRGRPAGVEPAGQRAGRARPRPRRPGRDPAAAGARDRASRTSPPTGPGSSRCRCSCCSAPTRSSTGWPTRAPPRSSPTSPNWPKVAEIRDAPARPAHDRRGRRRRGRRDARLRRGQLAAAVDTFPTVDTAAEDPAIIIYTSGTTGPPKGALHAHRFLLGHLPGVLLPQEFPPQPGDLFWTPADWAWIGGLYDVLFPAWHWGLPVLAHRARQFDPERALDLMARHGVRNVFLPPTALKLMRRSGAPARARTCACGRSAAAARRSAAELLDWGRETPRRDDQRVLRPDRVQPRRLEQRRR